MQGFSLVFVVQGVWAVLIGGLAAGALRETQAHRQKVEGRLQVISLVIECVLLR